MIGAVVQLLIMEAAFACLGLSDKERRDGCGWIEMRLQSYAPLCDLRKRSLTQRASYVGVPDPSKLPMHFIDMKLLLLEVMKFIISRRPTSSILPTDIKHDIKSSASRNAPL